MSYSSRDCQEFKALFKGNDSFIGRTDVGTVVTGQKSESKSWSSKRILTIDDVNQHINGTSGIGVSPLTETSSCYFGVIDVDEYTGQHNAIVNAIYECDLPLRPFNSKSGGLHLYLFFADTGGAPAKEVRALLRGYCNMFNLPKKTEIYPNRDYIEGVSTPGWINLPYFDADNADNPRKLIVDNHSHVGLVEGLANCYSKQLLMVEHKELFYNAPLSDAPPCLQTLYMLRSNMTHGDFRNNFMFSMAVYYKFHNIDTWEHNVITCNDTLGEPMDSERLEKTVLSSNRSRQYFYKCGDAPCSLFCQKQECYQRKYGVGSDENSGLNYEDLHQYMTDPPYYVWYINGKALRFFSESDMLSQSRFHELCVRYLHIAPNKIRENAWRRIINTALGNVEVHDETDTKEISSGGMWWKYTTDFFLNRRLADIPGQLKIGRTYKDVDKGKYIFSGATYIEFIRNVKGFKAYSDVELQAKLKDNGAHVIVYDGMPYWSIPIKQVDRDKIDINADVKDTDVDFLDKPDDKEKY